MYMVWSGWSDEKHVNTQNLYIAHMGSPTHIDSARVLLHQPTQPWEQSMLGATTRAGVNEGPTTITHGNQTFLIYCAYAAYVLWMDLADRAHPCQQPLPAAGVTTTVYATPPLSQPSSSHTLAAWLDGHRQQR
jgi:GH43 family beta-xylosidase